MTRALTLDDIYRVPIVSSPQLSPDGSQVAYVVSVADRESDSMVSRIWLVPSNGAGRARPLTAGPYDRSPRWSPDGRSIAFTSKRQTDSQAQVFLISATGGEARKITELELGAGAPVWSPDGAKLAFVGTVDLEERSASEREHAPLVVRTADYKADGKGLVRGLRDHLFVAEVASGDTEPVTSGDYWVSNPVWSPDSARLAFDAAMHPDRDLEPGTHAFVVDAGGGEPQRVTTGTGSVKTAAFTPDGERLLLCGTDRDGVGHNRLLLQELDGSSPRDVAPGFDRNLMFGSTAYPGAPPQIIGDTILFCARDRGCTHVFSVSLDGGTPRRIIGNANTVASGLHAVAWRIAFVGASPQGPGEIFVAETDGASPTDADAARRRSPRLGRAPDAPRSASSPRPTGPRSTAGSWPQIGARRTRPDRRPSAGPLRCCSTSTVGLTTRGARCSTACTSITNSWRREDGASCSSTPAAARATARSSSPA